jgi:hypothetical protein
MIQRLSLKIIMLIAGLFLLLVATSVPSFAQQAEANDTGALPITFILDSMMGAHEQDIKEKMFEYNFEAASDDPAAQVELVKKRSDELKHNTVLKKGILIALMARNGSVSGDQFAAIVDEMGAYIEKLNGWSKKLEEHAAGLAMLNGNKVYTDSVVPLMDDVKDAKDLASKASKEGKDKKNDNNGKKK